MVAHYSMTNSRTLAPPWVVKVSSVDVGFYGEKASKSIKLYFIRDRIKVTRARRARVGFRA